MTVIVITHLGSPLPVGARVVERIIARVNNEIITKRMFDRELQKLRTQLAQNYSGAELEAKVREQSKDLLRDLIDQALMVQKAKDLDINVETEVVKQLDEMRQESNLQSLEDLQREVEKSGVLFEDFKDQIRRHLLMREVIGREVGSRIVVSREETRQYFEEHKKEFESPGGMRLAQILISSENRTPEEVEARTQQVLAELKKGTRWADVAKKYSDHPSSKDGGNVGFFRAGALQPAIAAALDKLEVNETSDVIDTKFGKMIFKVLEKYSPGVPTFEEIEGRVSEYLYSQKMQPALREYLVKLRKESFLFLAPGYVDTGAERPSEAIMAKKGP